MDKLIYLSSYRFQRFWEQIIDAALAIASCFLFLLRVFLLCLFLKEKPCSWDMFRMLFVVRLLTCRVCPSHLVFFPSILCSVKVKAFRVPWCTTSFERWTSTRTAWLSWTNFFRWIFTKFLMLTNCLYFHNMMHSACFCSILLSNRYSEWFNFFKISAHGLHQIWSRNQLAFWPIGTRSTERCRRRGS